MKNIIDATAGVRIGQPMVHSNLTVFPLFGSLPSAADYLTLDEALEQKCAAVTEVSEGGSVPELKFVNSGEKRVFLLDGEQLVGAKQNRVLNLSILVAGGKVIIIPVTCVESGRWRHRSDQFSSSASVHYAEGRARKMAQVSASMRATGRRNSDQGRVWADISEKSARFSVASETSAMNDIYDKESERLQDYTASFSTLEGQSGAVFAIDGQIVGLDLFDSAETLKKLFPKLLNSYGLDALDRARSKRSKAEKQCMPADVEGFLKSVREAKMEEFPAVGEGVDIRFSGRDITGAALAVDDRIVHLSAFAGGN
ncbi:MAG: hypothetical protein H6Q07_1798 [Acidobacteria bacterium]|nr:hypothetical protein [Acidobacteriota bacterium]